MTSEPLSIFTNQSGCTLFREVWNVWNVISHTSSQIKMAEDVEGFESAVQNACRVFGVEKLFPEQFKALKTFVSGTDVLLNLPTGFEKSLVFQMAPLVHRIITRPRWICSESNNNCNIPSSEPHGRSNKLLKEMWYLSWRFLFSEGKNTLYCS